MSLNIPNKTDELKEIQAIFPKNLLNDLIIYKLQNIIKSFQLDYESKPRKT